MADKKKTPINSYKDGVAAYRSLDRYTQMRLGDLLCQDQYLNSTDPDFIRGFWDALHWNIIEEE